MAERLTHRRARCWRLAGLASLAALLPALLSGCSIMMAAHQRDRPDASLLGRGTPRNVVLAAYGNPLRSEMRDGKRVEVFSRAQGDSVGAKTSRVYFHTAADIFTCGLWEVVGTPTELLLSAKKTTIEVTYDQNDRVETITPVRQASAR